MIPEHYSRDIAQRCLSLINDLRDAVRQNRRHAALYSGPLSTTFLLAMAAPMIILPIERMFKPSRLRSQHAGDERELDPNLSEQIVSVLGGERGFGECSFFRTGHWSYVHEHPKFNVAAMWPDQLLHDLGTEEAKARATDAQASRILLDLRNALAHGGIAYLDENGLQTESAAAMLAFASAVIRRNEVVAVNVLRIGESEFREFLQNWADWLDQPRVRRVIEDIDPLGA